MSNTTVTANGATARERKLIFRGGGFAIEQRTWISILAFIGLIALWQLVTGVGLVSPIFLPSPMRVLSVVARSIVVFAPISTSSPTTTFPTCGTLW